MSAVPYGDRRKYQHIAQFICDRFAQLIGNDRIASLSQMLSMCLAGTNSKNSLLKMPLFYLMCSHSPQLI